MQNLIFLIMATDKDWATCHLIGATTVKTDAAELANSARKGNNFRTDTISVLAVSDGRLFSDYVRPQTAPAWAIDGVENITDELR